MSNEGDQGGRKNEHFNYWGGRETLCDASKP